MECYLAIKNNEVRIHATASMNLKNGVPCHNQSINISNLAAGLRIDRKVLTSLEAFVIVQAMDFCGLD